MDIEKYLLELAKKQDKYNVDIPLGFNKELKKTLNFIGEKNIYACSPFGSSIKKTNSTQKTVLKFLVPIKPRDKRTLPKIVSHFRSGLEKMNLKVENKQFSLLFEFKQTNIELFITRKLTNNYNFYSMYNIATKEQLSTNFDIHNSIVINQNFQKEIILMKLWREKHKLNFPTMYLELVVVHVLKNCPKKNLFSRIIRILNFLRKDFSTEKFYDPSNTNNVVSNCISLEEKERIKIYAKICMTEEYIKDIIS